MSLKRTKRQITAINRWIESDCKGTLEFATGVGKTMSAMIAIKKLRKTNKNLKVNVVVPTKYLKAQWEKELKNQKITKVNVYVINTYLKSQPETDLLILDEIHNYGSEQRIKIFDFKYSYILGLTATIYRKDMMHQVIEKYAPVVDTIDLEEAREEGYVSDYIVYNLGITLSEQDKMYYTFLNKEFYKHFAVFGRDFNLAMSCLADKNARERYSKLSGLEPDKLAFHAVRFNKFMQLRKNFLYNLPSKADVAKTILAKFPETKTITFSENTDFADKLTELIPDSVSYHSNLKKSDKNLSLEKFHSNKARVINSSKALDEGTDIGDIELVIITSSRAVERVNTQRTGRGIRFKPNKLAVIVNIYVKKSKDEEWLLARQNKSSNIYWIENVTDIKFERPKIRVS